MFPVIYQYVWTSKILIFLLIGSYLFLSIIGKHLNIRLITSVIAVPRHSFNIIHICNEKCFQHLRDNVVQVLLIVLPMFSIKKQILFLEEFWTISLNKRYISLSPGSLVHEHRDTVLSSQNSEDSILANGAFLTVLQTLWCTYHLPYHWLPQNILYSEQEDWQTVCSSCNIIFFWNLLVMFLFLAFETCLWAWPLMLVLLGSPIWESWPTMLLNAHGGYRSIMLSLVWACAQEGFGVFCPQGLVAVSCLFAEQTSCRAAFLVLMEETQRECLSSLSRNQICAINISAEDSFSLSSLLCCINSIFWTFSKQQQRQWHANVLLTLDQATL